jgi:hypothetical protein
VRDRGQGRRNGGSSVWLWVHLGVVGVYVVQSRYTRSGTDIARGKGSIIRGLALGPEGENRLPDLTYIALGWTRGTEHCLLLNKQLHF